VGQDVILRAIVNRACVVICKCPGRLPTCPGWAETY
jgi:hypothetical protein